MASIPGAGAGLPRPQGSINRNQSYDSLMDDASKYYLSQGGTQDMIDKYKAENPDRNYNKLFGDASNYYKGSAGFQKGAAKQYFKNNNPLGSPRRAKQKNFTQYFSKGGPVKGAISEGNDSGPSRSAGTSRNSTAGYKKRMKGA